MNEMHNVPYAGNPLYQNKIAAVISQYFWLGMKKYIYKYIVSWMECQRVKVEHRHPKKLIQLFPILEWKWDVMTIDFINKFPNTWK